MKLKVTVKMKNGCKVSMIKRVDDPPKGTPLDIHYMFEAQSLVEAIQNGGLCLSIPPNNIDRILITPREGSDNDTTGICEVVSGGGNLQVAGVHS
jgi:hypothetical protein